MTKQYVFIVYDLSVEVRRPWHLSASEARDALLSAPLDGYKPVAVLQTETAAEEYLARRPGRIDDYGTYQLVHGLIAYEADAYLDDDGTLDDIIFGGAETSAF